jgi:hypothetical protein
MQRITRFAVFLVPSTASVLADTIRGSNDRDIIYGTPRWDTISALEEMIGYMDGRDIIWVAFHNGC